jgi:hypothetical protein
MNRRTFMKAAAGTPILAATAQTSASQGQVRTTPWPEKVAFENPIGGPFSVHFVEELPLVFRGYGYRSSFEKEPELFRFTAHEWVSDAVLFRGLEIKPKNPNPYPSRISNQELLDAKLSIYIDDEKVLDRWSLSAFMKEGGEALPVDGRAPSKYQCPTFRGWVDKDGFPDTDQFLGYFLTNKACVVAKIEDCEAGSISVEIKLDMARYGIKKQ